jgi:hypothetical protein
LENIELDIYSHNQIPYVVSNNKVNALRQINRVYARHIGALPIAQVLPQRISTTQSVTQTRDRTLVHIMEHLVELAPWEISQHLNLILTTPNPSTSTIATKNTRITLNQNQN